MYGQVKNQNYQKSLEKNNILISEYIGDDDFCWFKCNLKTNKNNIIENIQNKDYLMENNPFIIDIIVKENIYYNHIDSPAPLLGIPEQELIYDLKINDQENIFIEIVSVETDSIFEDTERCCIKYLIMESDNINQDQDQDQDIEIYIIIKLSQKIVGNKHIKYLRTYIYSFLKSIQ